MYHHNHVQYLVMTILSIYTLPTHIHYVHVSIVVVFEFSDIDRDGREETGVITVRVIQSVETAVPITLTITPTEYSDDFGFDISEFDSNSPNIATRTYVCLLPLYFMRCLLRLIVYTYDHQLLLLVTIRQPC